MPVRPADPPDPARLTLLGAASVGGRVVGFGTATSAPRLWMALEAPAAPAAPAGADRFAEARGAAGSLLGYVTGLVVGEPELWVCEGAYREWVLDTANAQALKRAAARVWCSCIEECEG